MAYDNRAWRVDQNGVMREVAKTAGGEGLSSALQPLGEFAMRAPKWHDGGRMAYIVDVATKGYNSEGWGAGTYAITVDDGGLWELVAKEGVFEAPDFDFVGQAADYGFMTAREAGVKSAHPNRYLSPKRIEWARSKNANEASAAQMVQDNIFGGGAPATRPQRAHRGSQPGAQPAPAPHTAPMSNADRQKAWAAQQASKKAPVTMTDAERRRARAQHEQPSSREVERERDRRRNLARREGRPLDDAVAQPQPIPTQGYGQPSYPPPGYPGYVPAGYPPPYGQPGYGYGAPPPPPPYAYGQAYYGVAPQAYYPPDPTGYGGAYGGGYGGGYGQQPVDPNAAIAAQVEQAVYEGMLAGHQASAPQQAYPELQLGGFGGGDPFGGMFGGGGGGFDFGGGFGSGDLSGAFGGSYDDPRG